MVLQAGSAPEAALSEMVFRAQNYDREGVPNIATRETNFARAADVLAARACALEQSSVAATLQIIATESSPLRNSARAQLGNSLRTRNRSCTRDAR
jgi:hypothetical protein